VKDLPENIHQLRQKLTSCRLCPRNCGVDRTAGQLGQCGIGAQAIISSAMAHFGEEQVLVGYGGSGTIFFCGCNLHCVYCQNFDISQSPSGRPASPKDIAQLARQLVESGCENVNFVSPTHIAHAVAEAIVLIRRAGITAPTVYNCGGYESVEVLRLLEGLVDIYMPDFKYADAEAGLKYSGVKDYPAFAQSALEEMYRQVATLQLDDNGIARRGVLVRHLVLPNDIANSRKVIEMVAHSAPGCTINIMRQYRPAYRAGEFAELLSYPSHQSVNELRLYAGELGLKREGVES